MLIPKTVNKKPLTLNLLAKLIKTPQKGNPTQIDLYTDFMPCLAEVKYLPIATSYWALITKDIIPKSQNQKLECQKLLIKAPYAFPFVLEALACIAHFLMSVKGQHISLVRLIRDAKNIVA